MHDWFAKMTKIPRFLNKTRDVPKALVIDNYVAFCSRRLPIKHGSERDHKRSSVN